MPFGFNKNMELVFQYYWSSQLWKYVKEFVRSCDVCVWKKMFNIAFMNSFSHTDLYIVVVFNIHRLHHQSFIFQFMWLHFGGGGFLTTMVPFVLCTKIMISEKTTKLFFYHFFGIMASLKSSFLIVNLSLHPSLKEVLLKF